MRKICLIVVVAFLSACSVSKTNYLKRGKQVVTISKMTSKAIDTICLLEPTELCNKVWYSWLKSKLNLAIQTAEVFLVNRPENSTEWIEAMRPVICDLLKQKWPAMIEPFIESLKLFDDIVCP